MGPRHLFFATFAIGILSHSPRVSFGQDRPESVIAADIADGAVPKTVDQNGVPDNAFDSLIDLLLIRQAINKRDAVLLTDAALQLREAERVLMRAHPAITSTEILEVAFRLAIESRDDATLDRLERFARQHKMAAFGQRLAARKPTGEARSNDPPMLIRVEEISAEACNEYHAIIAEIKAASYCGDRKALKSIEEQLDAASALTASQKEDLRSFISTRDMAAGGAEEPSFVGTLDRLMAGSRQGGFSLVGDSNKLNGLPMNPSESCVWTLVAVLRKPRIPEEFLSECLRGCNKVCERGTIPPR
jgi:hypothetical protein